MSVTALSRSKINLYLKVTGRRFDGYHLLESLFVPVEQPADRIEIDLDARPGIALQCSDPELPAGEANLAGKAARLYSQTSGISPTWSITIEKNIPVAAGLGGGSSNAATVLNLLNGFYRAVNPVVLAELALQLGADVPYFLQNHAAVARGIGEILSPLEFPAVLPPLLLVNPRFPVSARWAYEHFEPGLIGEAQDDRLVHLLEGLRSGDVAQVAAHLHNDLAAALYHKFPLLCMLRDFMLDHGALGVGVTGSGPTLFAVCGDEKEMDELRSKVREEFEAVTVF